MNQNKSLFNTTLLLESKQKRIFDNPIIITIVFFIGLIIIIYAFYYYFSDNIPNIKYSSTYYGKDLAFYTPLFNNSSPSIEDCIKQCQNDIICDGITYNTETSYCTGTKQGILRNDNSNYIAWIKDVNNNKKLDIINNIKKNILVGRVTGQTIIDNTKFQDPYQLGSYSFCFTMTIFDFYKNYGVWRHVFHKGTPIDLNNKFNYQSWENLEKDLPDQTIGVWISPFTNNLRIAITTTQQQGSRSSSFYNDAFIQRCNPVNNQCYITDMPSGNYKDTSRITDGSIPNFRIFRQIEYFDHDLKNIPINQSCNIVINIINNYVEILINGKIVKSSQLRGTPTFNKFPMYIMNDLTFGGEIKNILYIPFNTTLNYIKNITTLTS